MDTSKWLLQIEQKCDEDFFFQISQSFDESNASVKKAFRVLIPFVLYKVISVSSKYSKEQDLECKKSYREVLGSGVDNMANAVATHCGLSNRSAHHILEILVDICLEEEHKHRFGYNVQVLLNDLLADSTDFFNVLLSLEQERLESIRLLRNRKITIFKWLAALVLLVSLVYIIYQNAQGR